MRENQLHELIAKLNMDGSHVLVFSRPLQGNVEIAIQWIENANDGLQPATFFGPQSIYLLKDECKGKYIGLVEDRGMADLHWFVLPEFRAKGYMSKALKTIILPHLFQDNRDFQSITIDRENLSRESYEASSQLAKAIGFVFSHLEEGKENYMLSASVYSQNDYIDGDLSILTDNRAHEIRTEIKYHFTKLMILQSELEMKLGTTDALLGIKEELEDLCRSFDSIISDAYADHNIADNG